MILNSSKLKAVKLENDKPKQVYGRPTALINDLLDTISHLKKEKSKWKTLAQRRGQNLQKAKEVIDFALTLQDPETTEDE